MFSDVFLITYMLWTYLSPVMGGDPASLGSSTCPVFLPKETRACNQGGSWDVAWSSSESRWLGEERGCALPSLRALWNVTAAWHRPGEKEGTCQDARCWNTQRKQRTDSWHFPVNLAGGYWALSRNVLSSTARRCVKAELVCTFLSRNCHWISYLRVSKIKLALQTPAVRWQQRKEVVLRSRRKRTCFLLLKPAIGRLITAY